MNYLNNTNTDVSAYDSAIFAAIKNGGVFGEEGSAAEYVLTFA